MTYGPSRHATKNTTPITSRDDPGLFDEAYEERAAIMEYCGGMSREEAERKAAELIRDAQSG